MELQHLLFLFVDAELINSVFQSKGSFNFSKENNLKKIWKMQETSRKNFKPWEPLQDVLGTASLNVELCKNNLFHQWLKWKILYLILLLEIENTTIWKQLLCLEDKLASILQRLVILKVWSWKVFSKEIGKKICNDQAVFHSICNNKRHYLFQT